MSLLGHGGGKWVEECLWTNYQPVLNSGAMSDLKSSQLLEALNQQIRDAESAIRAITNATRTSGPAKKKSHHAKKEAAPTTPKPKRKLSAKARKAISDAQKLRWSKVKSAKK